MTNQSSYIVASKQQRQQHKRKPQRRGSNVAGRVLNVCAVGWVLVCLCLTAAPAYSSTAYHFDIPRQSADGALIAFGRQADITVLYQYDQVKRYTTNPLRGRYTAQQAIVILLQHSGLSAKFHADDHLVISEDKSSYGEIEMNLDRKNLLAATIEFLPEPEERLMCLVRR